MGAFRGFDSVPVPMVPREGAKSRKVISDKRYVSGMKESDKFSDLLLGPSLFGFSLVLLMQRVSALHVCGCVSCYCEPVDGFGFSVSIITRLYLLDHS